MTLPIKISPNPLISSLVEIRFHSELTDADMLSSVLPIFSKDFKPSFGKIPKELREKQPEQFKYAPDFILSNDIYSISFGKYVITFENFGEYTFWGNYFAFIKEQLAKFLSLNIVTKIERIGVRYVSILENVNNAYDVLNYFPSLSVPGYTEILNIHRATFIRQNCTLLLQILNNSKVTKNNIPKTGCIIDIDAITTSNITNDNVYSIIDKLHSEEKEFFFTLLNAEYLQQLNPQYK